MADRSPRGLVVVSGPDATSFLQSLVSQDLDAIGSGASGPSLLLTPKGKLDAVFRATRVGDDEWWLDTEADYGPRLAESLTRYRIRVKADIEDRTASTGLVSAIGLDVAGGSNTVTIPTRWGDVNGIDVVGPVGALESVLPDAARCSPEAFEAFRIEHGVPRLGVDIDDTTIPQEAFLERDAVSFTKGCFLGQELVARIDTRGHVNRYLRQLRVDGPAVPARGAVVHAGDKEVGAVTSAASVPGEDRVVALAMVRREINPPADVTLRWDGGQAPAHVLASRAVE
ncbi:MAG: glycine cleavage T C-terminal barrel domain-containing protein [Acidimicrobiia bacterium]